MTRIVVAREGENINNCIILPGALRCEDEYIPVDWNGDKSRIIGKASKMERNEETNEVSFEIELDPTMRGLDLDDNIGGFVYVAPFEAKQDALVRHAISEVVSGRIRQVSLQDLGPGAVFRLPKEN